MPLLVLVTSSYSWGQSAYEHRNRGLGLGAIMGAVTGGVIGDRNDEALAGAAIGAAVGGLTGAVIGNGVDNEMAYRETRAGQRGARPATIPAANAWSSHCSGRHHHVAVTAE